MSNFKKVKKKKFFTNFPFIIIIFMAFLFLGIGYAQISDIHLDVNGTATAIPEPEVLITNISYDSSNIADPDDSSINSFYLTVMNSTIVLGNDLSSTITYSVSLLNNSSIPVSYSGEFFSEDLGYDNSDIEFEVNGINVNDIMSPDETKVITITFKYVDSLTSITNDTLNSYIRFEFAPVDKVARIGDQYYNTLQQAVNAVPTDDVEKTIVLLKNASEAITISAHKNINFDFRNNTLSNNGNFNVIENKGTMKISNGTIITDAATNGAVNNMENATAEISGGRIISNGGRQAFYNKGTSTISGDVYMYSSATERAAVSNVKGATMTITGGTIISTGANGLDNEGTLTIGEQGGNVDITTPSIQGKNNGVGCQANLSFYDGIIKGKNNTFDDITRVTVLESGYGIGSSTEVIDGSTYKTAYLDQNALAVTFNPNGGNTSEPKRYVESGHEIGTLPTATRQGYNFNGWFTAKTGGTQIDSHHVITSADTFYAQWTQATDIVQIGNTTYGTITAAVNAVPDDNTQTTIKVLKDTSDWVTITADKNIILDLNGKTVTSINGKPIIENSGTLEIINGNMNSGAAQSIINNIAGSLTIDSVRMVATGTKQGIYITGGTVEITGNSYISSKTTGVPTGGTTGRATVHNISGTLIITSGTIVGESQHAVANEGFLRIGVKDGAIDTSTPILRGQTYGIQNIGTLNFYDGLIEGVTGAIDGTFSDIEDNSQVVDGTEVINNKTYLTKNLENT